MGDVLVDTLLRILITKMQPIQTPKILHSARKTSLVGLRLALALPLVAMLASCGQVDLSKGDTKMTKIDVTQGVEAVQYPDDVPSAGDGKIVWGMKEANCAQCHGDGTGGSAKVNFSDKTYMDQQKPVDQYMFVAYGENAEHPKNNATKAIPNHPAMIDKLTKRQIWDLVFYARSLARPVLTSNDPGYLPIDAVFGGNCAVCHGKKGNADGPLAHGFEPSPANFGNLQRFYDRTDAVLWDHIANGIPWEGMPNFLHKQDRAKNVNFDEAYIWKLVQYVRHFQSTDLPTMVAESNKSQENTSQETKTAAPGGNKEQNQDKPAH